MAKNMIDRKTGVGLRGVLIDNLLDGTEAGSVQMTASDLLDEVIDLTYKWLRGESGGREFDGREVSEMLAVLPV